jgi:hypothetical protein
MKKNTQSLFRHASVAIATSAVWFAAPAAFADDAAKGSGPQPPAFIDRAGKAIEKGVKKVGEGATWVGEKIGEGAKKVGSAVDRGAEKAAKKAGVDTSKPDPARKKAEPENAGK